MSRRTRSYWSPDPAPGARGWLTLAAVWGIPLVIALLGAATK